MNAFRMLMLAVLSLGLFSVVARAEDAGKTDAEIIAAQKPTYPLKTCVVSGEKLGAMGQSIDLVVQGRLVELCCKGCVKTVKADPAKYLKLIDDASNKDNKTPDAGGHGGHQH